MNEITAPTLRRLMENDPTLREVRVSPTFANDPGMDYYNRNPGVAFVFPRGTMGWKIAGEIIGNSASLEKLEILGAGEGTYENRIQNLKVFFNGAARNNSIICLSFEHWDVLGGSPFLSIPPMLKNSRSLTELNLWECDIGNEGLRFLVSALLGCEYLRLEQIIIHHCFNGGGEPFEELIAALKCTSVSQPGHVSTLTKLALLGNNIGRNGCIALAKMLSDPHCGLQKLGLLHNNIDDEGIVILASGLAKNDKLELLDIAKGNPITSQGWAPFLKILCSTDSINDTYLSNHKLNNLGQGLPNFRRNSQLPTELEAYLQLNRKNNQLTDGKGFIRMQKILDHYHEWNMLPFIEEDLLLLPYILGWMDRASIINSNVDTRQVIGRSMTAGWREANRRTLKSRRNLTIHQFVRSLPVVVVEKLMMKES